MVLGCVRDVLVWFVPGFVFPGDTVAGGHGHVGDEGDGRGEGDQDVEDAFWLHIHINK